MIMEFHLKDTQKIYWFQINNALPKSSKDTILKNKENAKNLVIFVKTTISNLQS